MEIIEEPIVFQCLGETLFGLLHILKEVDFDTGVLIVVGGPQYRVGSHRQFVELARGLAKQGIPVFRFDCMGMGDSTGEFSSFKYLDDDIRCAVDVFKKRLPAMHKLVIWGLCDGATAACFYAPSDSRVTGLCLANPWVRTEQGEAEAYVKYYYLSRLLSEEFWRKVFTGRLHIFRALGEFLTYVWCSISEKKNSVLNSQDYQSNEGQELSLPAELFRDLMRYSGKLMFVISGNDLTASEFMDSVEKNNRRKKLIESSRVTTIHLPDADHTFSRKEWMTEVVNQTAVWVKSI